MHDLLCHITALLLHKFIFLQLSPQLIVLEFRIRQILQPAETPPLLRNLVVSPVRHAELEQEDVSITQLIGKDSETLNGIFRYFAAPFSKNDITSMSGMLFLLFVQSLFQFGAKRGNERVIMGRKLS